LLCTVKLYTVSSIRLHGVALNYLRAGTTYIDCVCVYICMTMNYI
jgi:hypothetical protein